MGLPFLVVVVSVRRRGVGWNRRSDAGTATCPDRRVGDEKALEV